MTRVLDHLDRVSAGLVPCVVAALLATLSAVPAHLPAAPNLGLIAVFYWTLHRPEAMPAFAALVLGLWQDILLGAPIGLHGVGFLLAHAAITFQRRLFSSMSFVVLWWAFGLTASLVAGLWWLATAVHHWRVVDPTPLAWQIALTVAVYPFLTWLFAKIRSPDAAPR